MNNIDYIAMQLETDPIELDEWHNKIDEEKTLEELEVEREFLSQCG
ncbi:hypothetical protein NVP1029O_70 [Vibrio phage 1.029.O._10N.261.55.A7]|nr:hypothetical protein NVP1029O_70 [Vibrio phage 1.029.O._10N.261.55.A7]